MRSFLSHLKYEANFKLLQLQDWVSELRSGDWWAARSPHIRWWRSLFYTGVALAAYGFSIYFFSRAGGRTYVPQFIINWLWSGWNWFFWPAIIAFWLEEVIDAGQPVENRWNPWPKKLFATYVGIISGSLLLAFLAFVTQHKVFVKELQGQKSSVSVQEKKVELEKELAEVEGEAKPESTEFGEEKEEDEFFKGESEDEDSFFSGEKETSKRPAWKIKWELWELEMKEKALGKIVGEDVSALWLRISRASGWIWYAFLWLPTLAFFLVTVFFAYGLEVLESRTVRLFGVGGKKEKKGGSKK